MRRINSIDFTRGLVMIVMALDHTRDLLHIGTDPTDLSVTTPLLFLTRWITHLCAPTFVFLSGVSAYLSFQNTELKENQKFLVSRGLWLVLLEFTIVGLGIWFDLKFRTLFFQVIGAIGIGFILLAPLIRLSSKTILIIGLAIIFLHNLLGLLPFNQPPYSYLAPLFTFSVFQLSDTHVFAISYPPIPWFGIMLLGYGFGGTVFSLSPRKRKTLLYKLGWLSLLLFVVLRYINIYGDPIPWKIDRDPVLVIMSFLNVTKYPPSLLYTLVTLGICFIILSVSANKHGKFIKVVSTYGKVPLFYYLIHWYIIHTAMFVMLFFQGFELKDLVFGSFQFGRPKAPSGLEIWYIYPIWLGIVALLYPMCKWYASYKAAHKDNKWLRYL
ncbi:DUF1624 domain-containing protein [Emticicia sp. TH156]|uniref:DUF1624 domain-containing protein n=1 Tax=Emticicia sp. TH156 TaxID=2067454 RepID=UPI000C7913B6|nr:heparan-alpha-glucosaminide N-acetyltransferase domain-containing protein [Emticicia sp. TH156]PLK43605.1 hypothetical protein C0V77_13870 [Emticicia sp. TH156]